MLNTGASYQETADQFKLNNPSLINRWMKEFNEQGVEGLKPKPKGRPSMSKKLTFGGVFMAKYSEEFKIKLVTEYLQWKSWLWIIGEKIQYAVKHHYMNG